MGPSTQVLPAAAENLSGGFANSTKRQMRHARWMNAILFAVFFIPLAVFLPGLPLQQACAAEQRTYSFGIVPQFEQRRLYSTWRPIIDDLEKRTGLKFRLVTTLKIQDFERAFFHGTFDFVYVNPYHIALLHDVQPYVPLVADTVPLRGILVARKDGPIQKPSDLNGKTVAFPSPNALGASLLVRADLDQVFHVKIEPLYVTTHSSVYLHVAKDLAAAGGGVEKTFLEQDAVHPVATARDLYHTPLPLPSGGSPSPRAGERPGKGQAGAAGHEPDPGRQGNAAESASPGSCTRSMTTTTPIMQTWGLQKYWQPIREGN